MKEVIESWQARIRQAASTRAPLQIRGGGSKDFYGGPIAGALFETRELSGIVSYEPTELVVTVHGGTPLAALEALLAEQGQMLAFEPPHFGADATVGGMLAAGLSGPRRLASGAVRDFVLGVRIIDGRGDLLAFGGQVMKNVAGYDVSRLVCGSMGTLGAIVDVSLKVLPRPACETSLRFSMSEADAIDSLNRWGGQPLPLSGSAWHGGTLMIRLSGASAAVESAVSKLAGEVVPDEEAAVFWTSIREQRHAFFTASADGEDVLWRLAVPTAAAPLGLEGEQLIEWGGGLRWLRSAMSVDQIRESALASSGHATCFRGGDASVEAFQPLSPSLMQIQRRLKQAFDPAGIFNPGRLYNGL